jgi:hypothetical protein
MEVDVWYNEYLNDDVKRRVTSSQMPVTYSNCLGHSYPVLYALTTCLRETIYGR